MSEELKAPDWEGFGKAIMENWQYHCDIDAGDKFDWAVKFNVLEEIEGGFDPEEHDDELSCAEAGDPWYQLSEVPTPAWQDISTAPKLAYVWHHGKLVLARWNPVGLYGAEGWVDQTTRMFIVPQPTQHLVFEPPQSGKGE